MPPELSCVLLSTDSSSQRYKWGGGPIQETAKPPSPAGQPPSVPHSPQGLPRHN